MSGPPDLLLAAFHWLEYLGLLGGIGSFAIRRLGRQPPRIAWAEPPMTWAFAAAAVGGIGVLAQAPSLPAALRVIAEIAALTLCARGIPAVAPFAAAAALLLAPASHAPVNAPLGGGAVLVDAVHVLSAGMWAGGVLALAALRPPGGWSGPDARALVERFAGVASVAFAVTALTGMLRAIEELQAVEQLWTTEYGAVLLFKSAGVVAMLALSFGWRRGRPWSRLDAGAATLVVGATALLAAFPLPVN